MTKLWYLFLCSLLMVNCDAQNVTNTITTNELKILLNNKDIELLDVRTPEEVSLGIIKSAKVVNFFDEAFVQKASKILNKNKTVYLYCRTGNRSGKAYKILEEQGFLVVNVLGGYNQWQKENQ